MEQQGSVSSAIFTFSKPRQIIRQNTEDYLQTDAWIQKNSRWFLAENSPIILQKTIRKQKATAQNSSTPPQYLMKPVQSSGRA